MDWDNLHKADLSKSVAKISKESVYLLSDFELMGLLKMRGVDLSRKTRIDENGFVYYLE